MRNTDEIYESKLASQHQRILAAQQRTQAAGVPEDARMRAAAEMNRLGYGYHESHAASILIAAAPAQPAAQGQKEVQRLREALAGLLAIVDDSRGVAGYHLNGAIADWDEFPEVESARAMLAAAPQDEQFCDGHCTWLDHHPDCEIGKAEQPGGDS